MTLLGLNTKFILKKIIVGVGNLKTKCKLERWKINLGIQFIDT